MRTSRQRLVLVVVAFAACVAAVNALLTFVFVPYGSKSELAWQDYSTQGQLDCVVVGTSTTMRSIDPAVLDRMLGASSFNLATPSQLLDESYLAIKTAYEDHGISRVILGLSHSQVLRSATPNPCSPFMYERSRVVSARQGAEGTSYLLFRCGAMSQPSSVNMLFPWASSMVSKSLSDVVQNARMKIDGTTLYEAAAVNEPGITYSGKGFGTNDKVLNYNGSNARSYFAQERRDDVGVDSGNADAMDPSRARALDDLCSYCREHDIELVAIAPPLATFNIIEYGEDYFTLDHKLREFFRSRGANYYDMNLARPELFNSREQYFADSEHTNFEGAHAFSESVCELVRRLEAGKDTDDLFMAEDEYLQSIDFISCVFVDSQACADGVHLHARAMTGTGVDVEYQFCVKSEDGWDVVRDWSGNADYVYAQEDEGTISMRVNARKAGSASDYDRYRELVVLAT